MADAREQQARRLDPVWQLVARAGGLVALIAGLGVHQSEGGVVAGRWSLLYTAILAGATLLAAALFVVTLRRRAGADPSPSRRAAAASFDLSIACYGAGYLVGSVGDPREASRLLDLVAFGSRVPVAVVLEWLAMAALVVAGLLLLRRDTVVRANLVALTAGVALPLLVVEAWTRTAAIVAPDIQGFPTNRARIWDRKYVRFNSLGFRGPEPAVARTPGVSRILIIGDSFAFGYGIDHVEDRFGEQLAENLSAAGNPWEVITLARPNSHTRDHLEDLERGLALRPDLVVLLYVANDIDYLFGPAPRLAVLEGWGGVLGRFHPARIAFQNSYLVQEVYARLRHYAFVKARRSPGPDPLSDPAIRSRHLADLDRFVTRVREQGAVPVVIPYDIGVAALPARLEWYQRLVETFRDGGLPVMPVDSAFAAVPFKSLHVSALDFHPNEDANALLAGYVTPRLLRLWDESADSTAGARR